MTWEDDFTDVSEGPFYTEYLGTIQEETPDFGLGTITWDDTLTILYQHKTDIVAFFNTYYADYEIGSETESRFLSMLQRRYDDIKSKYDRAFTLYSTNDGAMLSPGKRTTSTDGGNEVTGTEDTPDTELSGEYITMRNTTTFGRTNTSTVYDKEIVDLVNDDIDGWHDLISDFVGEFGKCFINVMGRI